MTSWGALRTDALSTSAANRLRPTEPARIPLVSSSLSSGSGPIVAVTDYMRAVPDQVARWVSRPFTSLGTDGFGRSDRAMRSDVISRWTRATWWWRFSRGWPMPVRVKPAEVAKAIRRFGIDPGAPEPFNP